jgi:hypothetical protein
MCALYLLMETVTVSRDKLGQVISDVDQLVSHFEGLVEDQDEVAMNRMKEIQSGTVEGKTEKDLDAYLKERGVKVD